MSDEVKNYQDVNINWYPGHMAKARRQMEEQLSLVDIIIELRDARIPAASANPVLAELSKNKPVLIILNKADLADETQNRLWQKKFEHCLIVDSTADNLSKTVVNEVKIILKDKIEKARARGIRKKMLRAMVVGIPNVGKSTFINNIVRKKVAKSENRPGVTRNLQWIRIHEDLELLDTPGVLWPKIDDQQDALLLALVGSIRDDILDRNALAEYGLNHIIENYPGMIKERYGIEEDQDDLIEKIAIERKWLVKENTADTEKAVNQILKDIRNNKIGRITFQNAGE